MLETDLKKKITQNDILRKTKYNYEKKNREIDDNLFNGKNLITFLHTYHHRSGKDTEAKDERARTRGR